MEPGTTPAAGPGARVELLGKSDCHLCDDARAVVAAVCAELGVRWSERDLSAAPDELARWWDKVPVTLVDGRVHDYWRVDPDRLRAALGAPAAPAGERA